MADTAHIEASASGENSIDHIEKKATVKGTFTGNGRNKNYNFFEKEMLIYEATEILDESVDASPLPEVHAVVLPYDDDTLPLNTSKS